MADNSAIEWTDATWNPITGCSVVSPGCTNCYAMRLAGTRLAHHPSRAGLTRDSKAGPVWTGEVRFNPQWLDQPLRWSKPRMIFVCAHGDLFHESVPDQWIDRVFAVMALAPQHTFQVLTKRAERMWAYMSAPSLMVRIYSQACDMAIEDRVNVTLVARPEHEEHAPPGRRVRLWVWPLPNIWLGVSAEDQQRANERIPHLLATPAAVRWVSAEPLIGPVDLRLPDNDECYCDHDARASLGAPPASMLAATHTAACPHSKRIDWVVAGGESGPGARPMHPDWARGLRDQCNAAGVAFHFKQWGEWGRASQVPARRSTPGIRMSETGEQKDAPFGAVQYVTDGKNWEHMKRVGKVAAGRLLDGIEHNAMPGWAR